MKRLLILSVGAIAAITSAVSLHSQPATRQTAPPFRVYEATVADLQAAMKSGRATSREIVAQYLMRLGLYEDRLNAAIYVNPHALEEADALDRERAQGKMRGPLHGIPIALKDNIHTTHMPTTGGALAFAGYTPPYEATLTKNLRDAGAIIIAKAGLTELANWVAGAPNPMPGNYNAVGSFGFNPYDPRPDPREATFDGRPALQTGGSSSGVGTAASLWAANVGTDTGGSVISPSNANMLVGLRPTIGRISRYGVIPITADHDTAGPMTRTVTDAAILFGALESASPDPQDAATNTCTPPPGRDYTKFLNAAGLKGARIGIPRAFYYDRVQLPGEERPRGGINAEQAKAMAEAIAVLKQQGAIVVDPADVPSFVDKDPKNNFPAVGLLLRRGAGRGQGRELLDQLQVRHEARLQCLAEDARTVGAGEDADRAARMESCATRRQAPSSTRSRGWTSPTRWTSSAIARAMRPTTRRTCCSAAPMASTAC